MSVPVLRTARLVLRPLSPDDAPAIVAGVGDWDVAKWLTVVPHPYGAEDAQRFLTEIVPAAEAIWAIDDGAFAGVISVDGELGYWMARDRWGRGYATEAGRAVVDWHFARGARVLPSGYFDGNHRSGGVLAKLGFQPAGDRVKGCVARGQDVLSHRVVLTRAGWRAGQAGLSFRPLGPGDLEALTAIVSEWGVVRNLGSWPWPPEADFTARRAEPYQGEGFVWAVLSDGAMVGTIGVTGPEGEDRLHDRARASGAGDRDAGLAGGCGACLCHPPAGCDQGSYLGGQCRLGPDAGAGGVHDDRVEDGAGARTGRDDAVALLSPDARGVGEP